MKLYNRNLHRNVERQIHFGVGNSVKTACGLIMFSRYVMVSLHSSFNGAMITSDMSKVTCKRCLKTSEVRLRKFVAIEANCPGIFDRPTLCGESWLLNHALDVSRPVIDSQTLEVKAGNITRTLPLSMKAQDRKFVLKGLRERE